MPRELQPPVAKGRIPSEIVSSLDVLVSLEKLCEILLLLLIQRILSIVQFSYIRVQVLDQTLPVYRLCISRLLATLSASANIVHLTQVFGERIEIFDLTICFAYLF